MDSNVIMQRKSGEGKGYYDRCGAEAGVPELTRIFAMLSEDEARHAAALRAQRDGNRVELSHSHTLDGARCILRTLSVRDLRLDDFQGDLGRYLEAMDYEAVSVRLCGQLAREADQGWEKELFTKIAAEDEMHFTLLESMRELLLTAAGCTGNSDGDGVGDAE